MSRQHHRACAGGARRETVVWWPIFASRSETVNCKGKGGNQRSRRDTQTFTKHAPPTMRRRQVRNRSSPSTPSK